MPPIHNQRNLTGNNIPRAGKGYHKKSPKKRHPPKTADQLEPLEHKINLHKPEITSAPRARSGATQDPIERILLENHKRINQEEALSLSDQLFENRSTLIKKYYLITHSKQIKRLVMQIAQTVYVARNFNAENLARILGGIGILPRSLLPHDFDKFLVKQICRHKAMELSKLAPEYLSRMVLGLQNFRITTKLNNSLDLIAEAFEIQDSTSPGVEDAEMLSFGLQRFEKICPSGFLKRISKSLDQTDLNDTNSAKACVHIVNNLKGFTNETQYIPNILAKAAKMILTNKDKLPNQLLAKALIGLGANANKINDAKNIFKELSQVIKKSLKGNNNHDSAIIAREIIFACNLYQLRTGSYDCNFIVQDFTKHTKLNKMSHDTETLKAIADIAKPIFGVKEIKMNVPLLDNSVEADLLMDYPRFKLNLEIDGPQHHTAAHEVRDHLRDEILESKNIKVARMDSQPNGKSFNKLVAINLQSIKNSLALAA